MKGHVHKFISSWVTAAGIGVVGVVVVGWVVLLPNSGAKTSEAQGKSSTPRVPAQENALAAEGIAMRYAAAYQRGDAAEIIRMTWWMAERLRYVQMENGAREAYDRAYQTLCDGVQERRVEGNRVSPEGIEDQYIFAPGAALEVVGVDEGRQDLSKPVAQRTWIRVTYPSRGPAPRDEAGNAIRSVTVGVNISRDGYVLKAGVVGNLEIDSDSFSCDWPSLQGG